jgi:hypothetical protein
MFTGLCEEVGVEHTVSIFYCESRSWSRGNVLKWVFELVDELYQYLTEVLVSHGIADMFNYSDFIMKWHV